MKTLLKNRTLSFEEIRNSLSPLFEDKTLKLIFLFGSQATEKTHKKSDIDLAFLFNKNIDIIELTSKVIRLLKTDNVDVVDLNRVSPLLKYSAAKTSRLLYERSDGIFNEFYSLAFRLYIDTDKLRKACQQTIDNFIYDREAR